MGGSVSCEATLSEPDEQHISYYLIIYNMQKYTQEELDYAVAKARLEAFQEWVAMATTPIEDRIINF